MNYYTKEMLWELLLKLRNEVKVSGANMNTIAIFFNDARFEIFFNKIPEISHNTKAIVFSKEELTLHFPKHVLFQFDDNYRIRLVHKKFLDDEQVEFLLTYLPFCFYVCRAHDLKRAVSILHFAQTLDGRIATQSGNSKWIGNQENLVHSHRLRALCDAILVGGNTIKIDKPALNVRNVKGTNPIRVVVGNSLYDFSSLMKSDGKIFQITSNANNPVEGIEKIIVPETANHILPSAILKELYRRGIYSVFIEGGSTTASSFITDKSLDILQLFIAPKIFGSGICSFTLPSIRNVEESLSFIRSSYKNMGDGILFEGEVVYQKHE
jgi:riboflavin-specific deaminase-like protein